MSRVKGWCPGALRPMESGDGLVVRLRLSSSEASPALAREIAGWAEAFGNGLIDLSARGNFQLRGVSEATLPALTERLAAAGLIDASPEAEAVRNVLAPPLTDFDPAAPFDPRPDAKALERELGANPELWALPGKFGFSFDAGDFALGGGADVGFVAVGADAYVAVLADGAALGPFPRGAVVEVATGIARAFLALRRGAHPPRRMRDALGAVGVAHFGQVSGLRETRLDARPVRARADWLGAQVVVPAKAGTQGDGDVRRPLDPRFRGDDGGGGDDGRGGDHRAASRRNAFVGAALPFGRIHAGDLAALADFAAQADAPALRLTPWRAILIPGLTRAAAKDLAEAAAGLGLIVDPADPRLSVAACAGAPACSSAYAETRAAAARLAPLLGPREGIALHVSGCAKGCAWPQSAPFAVVAEADGYALIRDGRAGAAPFARGLTLDAVAETLKERRA